MSSLGTLKAPRRFLRNQRPSLLLILGLASAVGLGAALRFARINGDYFLLNDTTSQIALVKAMVTEGEIPPLNPPPGPGLALAPLLIPFDYSFLSTQIGIALFGTLLIPLAYVTVRVLLPRTRLAPVLAALFVGVNPAFVAISRVGFFDVMQVFFGVLFLLVVIRAVGNGLSGRLVLLSFPLGLFLLLMKEPNGILVLLGTGYLWLRSLMAWRAGGLQTRWAIAFSVGACIVLVVGPLFTLAYGDLRVSTTSSRFESAYFDTNLRALVNFYREPLRTPATAFSFFFDHYSIDRWGWMLAITQAAFTAVGAVSLLRGARLAGLLFVGSLTALGSFLLFYEAWMSRFGLAILFCQLILVAIGVEAALMWLLRSNIRGGLAILLAGVLSAMLWTVPMDIGLSVSDDVSLVRRWNSTESRVDNNMLVWPEDLAALKAVLKQNPSAFLISTQSTLAEAVDPVDGRDYLNLKTFGVARDNAPSALSELGTLVDSILSEGRDIIYVPGIWDLDNANAGLSRGYGMYLSFLTTEYNAELLYAGVNRHSNKVYRPWPTFAIYRLPD